MSLVGRSDRSRSRSAARVSRGGLLFVALTWLLLSLYPNPLVLGRSIQNLRHIELDPAAVAELADRLPDSPQRIEQIVKQRVVPYAYDWSTEGVPWYFPTTAEVLHRGAGDCESRAVVLASIFSVKGIPHELKMSFDHIWVDYPGKIPNEAESDALAIGRSVDGSPFGLHWPRELNVWGELRAQVELLWLPMPLARELLLFTGLALVCSWNALGASARTRYGVVAGDRVEMSPVTPGCRGRRVFAPRAVGGAWYKRGCVRVNRGRGHYG